jgi:hypothetical protein
MKLTDGGKYGLYTETFLKEWEATGVVLLVTGGRYGPGFSVAVRDPALIPTLPAALRAVADAIERDAQ